MAKSRLSRVTSRSFRTGAGTSPSAVVNAQSAKYPSTIHPRSRPTMSPARSRRWADGTRDGVDRPFAGNGTQSRAVTVVLEQRRGLGGIDVKPVLHGLVRVVRALLDGPTRGQPPQQLGLGDLEEHDAIELAAEVFQ